MSKPREFAHLIKNKFGSADNINTLSREYYINKFKWILYIVKKLWNLMYLYISR